MAHKGVVRWTAGRLARAAAYLALISLAALALAHERVTRFSHEIATTLPPYTLWAHLEGAFADSTRSPLWPHHLEEVHSDGLRQGASIQVTYRTPLGETTYTYEVTEYIHGRTMTYTSLAPHPLRGGGTVEVTPTGAGSLMRWSVQYQHPAISMAALYMQVYFRPRFFGALEDNLRRIEYEPEQEAGQDVIGNMPSR
jgi:hypothetical protein